MTSERHARIKRLFTATLELPDEERGPFLDRECAGDDGLRSEVESLLAFSGSETLAAEIRSEPAST